MSINWQCPSLRRPLLQSTTLLLIDFCDFLEEDTAFSDLHGPHSEILPGDFVNRDTDGLVLEERFSWMSALQTLKIKKPSPSL